MPECGKLLRDCAEHNSPIPPWTAQTVAAGLVVVGIGNAMVQNAVWLRCRACSKLWMKRRGELVETKAPIRIRAIRRRPQSTLKRFFDELRQRYRRVIPQERAGAPATALRP